MWATLGFATSISLLPVMFEFGPALFNRLRIGPWSPYSPREGEACCRFVVSFQLDRREVDLAVGRQSDEVTIEQDV